MLFRMFLDGDQSISRSFLMIGFLICFPTISHCLTSFQSQGGRFEELKQEHCKNRGDEKRGSIKFHVYRQM